MSLLQEFPDMIVDLDSKYTYTQSSVYAGKRLKKIGEREGVMYPVYGHEQFIVENGRIKIAHIDRFRQLGTIQALSLQMMNGNLFAIDNDRLNQIVPIASGNDRIILSIKNSWDIMPNSTRVFKNMLLSNIFGKYFAYMPAEDGCSIFSIPELTIIR